MLTALEKVGSDNNSFCVCAVTMTAALATKVGEEGGLSFFFFFFFSRDIYVSEETDSIDFQEMRVYSVNRAISEASRRYAHCDYLFILVLHHGNVA